jgi:hypothetical protein
MYEYLGFISLGGVKRTLLIALDGGRIEFDRYCMRKKKIKKD